MKTSLACLITLGALSLLTPPLEARTIEWGSTVGGSLITSTGADLGPDFSFELGTFGTGFTPTELNMSDWLANWKPFDRAYEGTGYESVVPFVDSSAALQMNGTSSSLTVSSYPVFASGERAYIWVYNTQTYGAGLEWALVTGRSTGPASDTAWFMPSPSDQTGLPLNWRFDTAASPVFGGLNSVSGPGDYTAAPPTYELQTHTIASIPEPGSALLLATLGIMVRLRLRRRR